MGGLRSSKGELRRAPLRPAALHEREPLRSPLLPDGEATWPHPGPVVGRSGSLPLRGEGQGGGSMTNDQTNGSSFDRTRQATRPLTLTTVMVAVQVWRVSRSENPERRPTTQKPLSFIHENTSPPNPIASIT